MPLDYIGDFDNWKIYKNQEGFYEAWKSGGKKVNILKDKNNNQVVKRTDHNHIITQAKNMSDFIKVVNEIEDRHKPKSSLPPQPQPSLFPPEPEISDELPFTE